MSIHYRDDGKYPEYPEREHALTDEYSWGDHGVASYRKDPEYFDSFDYEFAGDFLGGFEFGSVASMTDCTGLIPNGMTNDFEGLSYADLYENVHQPEGDLPPGEKKNQGAE